MFWDQDCYELASLLLYYILVISACYIYDSIAINLCSNHPIMVHMMSILFELMTLIYPSIFLWNCTWSFIPRLSVAIQVVVTLLKNYSFLDITYSDSLQYHHRYFYIPILHYVRFHFSPSLVYSNNMPLTQNIRLSYIFQKLMIILLSIFSLSTNVIEYMPLFEQYYRNEISFLYIYIQILPFIYTFFLLIFSVIFLGVCPLFAELTRWPDRRFFSVCISFIIDTNSIGGDAQHYRNSVDYGTNLFICFCMNIFTSHAKSIIYHNSGHYYGHI